MSGKDVSRDRELDYRKGPRPTPTQPPPDPDRLGACGFLCGALPLLLEQHRESPTSPALHLWHT